MVGVEGGFGEFVAELLFVFAELEFGDGGFGGVEGEAEDFLCVVVEVGCVFLFLVAAEDVAEHAFVALVGDEVRFWVLKEEEEAVFVVVDDFFPEVVALLVAFAGGGAVESAGVGAFVELEAQD